MHTTSECWIEVVFLVCAYLVYNSIPLHIIYRPNPYYLPCPPYKPIFRPPQWLSSILLIYIPNIFIFSSFFHIHLLIYLTIQCLFTYN